MRDAPDPRRHIHVESWLDVTNIDGAVGAFPLIDGSVTGKAMPDRTGDYVLDATVPHEWRGVDLVPRQPGDWFSCFGQEAQVRWELRAGSDSWTVRSTRFILEDREVDEAIVVSGHGLLSRTWGRKRPNARQWRAALARDVLGSVLAQNRVPLRVDSSMPKDELPFLWTQGTDDWQAVLDMLEAVSGILREDEWGAVLTGQPPAITEPVVRLTDGDAGTIVRLPRSFRRTDITNHVVVRGTDSFTQQDFNAEARHREGPLDPEGPYGYVTEEINNDAITRLAQAQLVATNTLVHRARYREMLRVETVTDWRLELDDPVEIRKGADVWWGRITAISMPVSGQGTMTLEVGTE
ncbi:hypothetical protein [Flaviflexus equikiangi]|uniref:Minor tail protein n=1 Tax=Flaviflexus equikiangi TaxID=2758573 RepID=A0ABS2TDB7_9ACTO|nr:hypothetical protein [Flaviflexus equikiangi]MBM9432333.1 hypothetical protein [Flaviflexus equikiangi]